MKPEWDSVVCNLSTDIDIRRQLMERMVMEMMAMIKVMIHPKPVWGIGSGATYLEASHGILFLGQ